MGIKQFFKNAFTKIKDYFTANTGRKIFFFGLMFATFVFIVFLGLRLILINNGSSQFFVIREILSYLRYFLLLAFAVAGVGTLWDSMQSRVYFLKKVQEELAAQAESLGKLFKEALKKENIQIKMEKLKNKKIASMITLSEESRRMQDMMKMYAMPGMDMSMFGGKEGETLVLNANHPLVQYVTEHEDNDNTKMICEQLYDLAKIQHAPLDAESMNKFILRSNEIMMLLTK